MITYSQNFEDVMLARLFAGRKSGFYVDIGACHPEELSVSKYFYDAGWRGINVEPIKENYELFLKERPRDINLNVAVGKTEGQEIFYQVAGNGALSTFDKKRAEFLERSGIKVMPCQVDIMTADSIFKRYAPESTEVDFLKVDVEGAEADVLLSLDFSLYRPKVLLIEAVAPLDKFPGWEAFDPMARACWDAWEPRILKNGYRFACFDGLNRYYLREDCSHLIDRMQLPPGVFDFIIPDLYAHWLTTRKSEKKLQEQLEEKEALIRKLADTEFIQEQLAEKEKIIQYLVTTPGVKLSLRVANFRNRFNHSPMGIYLGKLLRPVERCLHFAFYRTKEIFKPRLGNLCQHVPHTLVLPPDQAKPIALSHTPKISLVTPSYKQAAFIERTLESVLSQDYPNLEYFVQDGGSDDGTTEILKRYAARLSGWESTEDSGQSHAINLGLAKTTGEIMAWLNSDDILLPGALAYVAEYFNAHPEVDVVYGNRFLIDENDQLIGRWMLPPHSDKVLSWADYIPQETLFWRRRIWDKVGGRVDESFRFAMDWDLLIRFRDAGATFARLPRFLGGFRIHARQKTSADISEIGFQEMSRIRERTLGRVPSGIEIKKAVLTYMLHHVMTDLRWRIGNKWRMPA